MRELIKVKIGSVSLGRGVRKLERINAWSKEGA
jgi:hypothetical protein